MPWGFHLLSFLLGVITFHLCALFFWLLTSNVILSLPSHSNPILLFLVTCLNIIPFVMFQWLVKSLQPTPLTCSNFQVAGIVQVQGALLSSRRFSTLFFFTLYFKICFCKAKCRISIFNCSVPGIGTVLFSWVCVCVFQKMHCILILCKCCYFS